LSERTKNFWLGFLTPDKLIYVVTLIVAIAVNFNTVSKRLDSVHDQIDSLQNQVREFQNQVQGFNLRAEGVEKSNVKIGTQLEFLLSENDARAKEWKLMRELIGDQSSQIAVIKDRIARRER